jgi:hypothetical protein
MQTLDVAYAQSRQCRCLGAEPQLGELLRDPMTLALMTADRVDRRELDALFDRTRSNLRRRFRD